MRLKNLRTAHAELIGFEPPKAFFHWKAPRSSFDHKIVNLKHATFHDHLNSSCGSNAKLFSFFWTSKGLSQMVSGGTLLVCNSWWLWKLTPSGMPRTPPGPWVACLPICSSLLALWVLWLPCCITNTNVTLDLDFSQMSKLQSNSRASRRRPVLSPSVWPLPAPVSGFLTDWVIKRGGWGSEEGQNLKRVALSQRWEWVGEARQI